MTTASRCTVSHIGAVLAAGLSTFILGCQAKDPPQTVKHVDIERYMGLWYEIAKFPVFFERGLVGVTAEYSLESEGRIRVRNHGFKKTFNGDESTIEGYATVSDPEVPAKLQVRFDPFPVRFFPADYWIIDLGKNYEYAVVSNQSRRVLWILSRTPAMDADVYEQIQARLVEQGFDVERLEKTVQSLRRLPLAH